MDSGNLLIVGFSGEGLFLIAVFCLGIVLGCAGQVCFDS